MSSFTIAYDATHPNVGRLPRNAQTVGYSTGSSDVLWTAADRVLHPDAVMVCQDASATDATADVLDVERYAATVGEVANWSARALASYRSGARPGQRSPLIYASASSITPIANALTAASLANGTIGLFIADWSLTQGQAAEDILAASGPFPILGVQFGDLGPIDVDAFSTTWLSVRSARH